MTLFRFNLYGLTTNKFSTDIVQKLSKRNRFSIGHCAKFVRHLQCLTVSLHPATIEGCRRLPLGRNATNTTKHVTVKFVNRKHSEAMLQCKKDINKKSKVFVSHSLCPYYQFLGGKCKELQGKGQVNQIFCLGAIVTIRITGNNPAIKILLEKDLMVCQECPPESV